MFGWLTAAQKEAQGGEEEDGEEGGMGGGGGPGHTLCLPTLSSSGFSLVTLVQWEHTPGGLARHKYFWPFWFRRSQTEVKLQKAP